MVKRGVTMLDKLTARRLANEIITDLPPNEWSVLLGRIVLLMEQQIADRDERNLPVEPLIDTPPIIARVIDDLGEPEVTNYVQAIIWRLSADAGHRARGEQWFYSHEEDVQNLQSQGMVQGIGVMPMGLTPTDWIARYAPKRELPPLLVSFTAFFDSEAQVWVAHSDKECIATEAPTKEALIERINLITPDVLSANHLHLGKVTIEIDWHEVLGHSEYALN
jgi:hypothetical protein